MIKGNYGPPGSIVGNRNPTTQITVDSQGNVSFASGVLYVDDVNNRVGINTTAPTAALQITNGSFQVQRALAGQNIYAGNIEGEATNRIRILSDGKIDWGDGASLDLSVSRAAAKVLGIHQFLSIGHLTAATADIADGGSISSTDQGLIRLSPAANRTGLILGAGVVTGQKITIMNISAFTLTFAAAGTSRIADGTSAVIAANRCQEYTWDATSARWYRS